MSDYFLSMAPDSEVEFDVVLATGYTQQMRVQNEIPETNVSSTNEDIATVEVRDPIIGAAKLAVISHGMEGVCDIVIDSGGTTIIEVVVETGVAVRWVPKVVAPNILGAGSNAPTPLPDPFPPGSVDGPNSSEHGDDFWIQRDEQDAWYVWWDIDADPSPDVRKTLAMFAADAEVDQAYKDDVMNRAMALGYTA